MIQEGTFREDLYYRLNVVKLSVPPLRERRDDIIPLSMFFWKHIQEKYQLNKEFPIVTMEMLHDYDWPGNVRELKNVIELMTVTSRGRFLEFPENLQESVEEKRKNGSVTEDGNLKEEKGELKPLGTYLNAKEKEYLIYAWKECKTTHKMAEKLKIDHSTVMRKIKKYHIQSPDHYVLENR